MTILGMSYTTNADGIRNTTLYTKDNFEPYFNNPDNGRKCVGMKVEPIYVGSYDCSNLKVGMEISIYYDKAIVTPKGTFQPVKKIEILEKEAK